MSEETTKLRRRALLLDDYQYAMAKKIAKAHPAGDFSSWARWLILEEIKNSNPYKK